MGNAQNLESFIILKLFGKLHLNNYIVEDKLSLKAPLSLKTNH